MHTLRAAPMVIPLISLSEVVMGQVCQYWCINLVFPYSNSRDWNRIYINQNQAKAARVIDRRCTATNSLSVFLSHFEAVDPESWVRMYG